MLWVPAAYWPEQGQHAKSDMFKRMTDDTLKSLGGLKFRCLVKFVHPPLSTVEAALAPAGSDEQHESCLKFCACRKCCLDPFWGQPVQDDVLKAAEVSEEKQLDTFLDHAQEFEKQARVVSLREEQMHVTQKQAAGGTQGRPSPFERQAAETVLGMSSRNFVSRGGPELNGAPAEVQKARTAVRKEKITHKRPNQFGNTAVFYSNEMQKQGSKCSRSDLIRQFKGLSEVEQSSWRGKHHYEVSSKRKLQRAVDAASADRLAEPAWRASKTPWGIGTADLPLDPEHVEAFLAPYRTQASGRAALAKLAETNADAERYLKQMEDEVKPRKYHSMDAAKIEAKAQFGEKINEATPGKGSWADALKAPLPDKGCWELHPGLCKTDDATILQAAFALINKVPCKSCLLWLELDRPLQAQKQVVLLRVTVGRPTHGNF